MVAKCIVVLRTTPTELYSNVIPEASFRGGWGGRRPPKEKEKKKNKKGKKKKEKKREKERREL